MTSGWVLRVAAEHRVCSSCWDRIEIGERYYRTVSGERLCWLCPPEDDGSCPL